MSRVFLMQYGESVTVEEFGPEAISIKSESTESIAPLLAAQMLGVELIQRSGVSQDGPTFVCEGVSTDEVTLARGSFVNLMFSKDKGATYTGEVLLDKDNALALGLELIRMAGE